MAKEIIARGGRSAKTETCWERERKEEVVVVVVTVAAAVVVMGDGKE